MGNLSSTVDNASPNLSAKIERMQLNLDARGTQTSDTIPSFRQLYELVPGQGQSITVFFWDASASMRFQRNKDNTAFDYHRFAKHLKELQEKNPDWVVYVVFFGGSSEERYHNRLGVGGLLTPEELWKAIEGKTYTDICQTGTDHFDIVEKIQEVRKKHQGQLLNTVVISDGEFDDNQAFAQDVDEKCKDKIQTLTIHIVPEKTVDQQHQKSVDTVTGKVLQAFAKGLETSDLLFSAVPFSPDNVDKSLIVGQKPDRTGQNSNPVFVGDNTWLVFKNVNRIQYRMTPEELLQSIGKMTLAEKMDLARVMYQAMEPLTHADQVRRLVNDTLAVVWKVSNALLSVLLKNVQEQEKPGESREGPPLNAAAERKEELEEEENQLQEKTDRLEKVLSKLTTAGSRKPEVQKIFSSAKLTDANKIFQDVAWRFALDVVYAEEEGQKFCCLLIPPEDSEERCDGQSVQTAVPDEIILAQVMGTVQRSQSVQFPGIESLDDEKQERMVPLIAPEDLPPELFLALKAGKLKKTVMDYTSLVFSGVLGMMRHRLTGFPLLRWILLLLYVGQRDGPLNPETHPNWSKLKRIFEAYVSNGNHGVDLHPLRLNKNFKNMLGESLTNALFTWGSRNYPTMCDPAFTQLLRQVAIGRNLKNKLSKGKIDFLEPESDNSLWQRVEKIQKFVHTDPGIRRALERFEENAHDAGTPIHGSGKQIHERLCDGLTAKEKQLFLFFLQEHWGTPVVEPNFVRGALSTKTCGLCGKNCKQVKDHVEKNQRHSKTYFDGTYDKNFHADSKKNTRCPACKAEFKTHQERDQHLDDPDGQLCRFGRTQEMWEGYRDVVRTFVQQLQEMLDGFIRKLSKGCVALTFEEIRSACSRSVNPVPASTFAQQESVVLLLGRDVAEFLGSTDELTVSNVCSVMESEAEAKAEEVALQMNSSYLQHVLDAAKVEGGDGYLRILGAKTCTGECFVCQMEVAGSHNLPCGHTICGSCLYSFCQVGGWVFFLFFYLLDCAFVSVKSFFFAV
jgi:hypothetical protein